MSAEKHITDYLKLPALIQVAPSMYVAQFEIMKISSVMGAIEQLLERNVINQNSVLIDSSSGLYALSLAYACHRYKLGCHIVTNPAADAAFLLQIELLGAKYDMLSDGDNKVSKFDQALRLDKVKELVSKNKNYYWMQQYHDSIHYAGYEDLTNMLFDRLGMEELQHVTLVGGLGSGCSTGGTFTHLTKKGCKARLCAVEPFGSVTFGSEMILDKAYFGIAGIGSSIRFENVHHQLYDSVYWINHSKALSGAVDLMHKHAIFGGASTGAAWCAANVERLLRPERPVVMISADRGHRYVKNFYADFKKSKPFTMDPLPKIIRTRYEIATPWSVFHIPRENRETALAQFLNKDKGKL